MNKTDRIERRRLFLLETLPAPLTRADRHVQIFDNYIANTRLRLRSMRAPETREWTWILQQRAQLAEDSASWRIAEIYLDEAEYNTFERFEGREIRKNRYVWETGGKRIETDVFLGDLWGLLLARASFESEAEMNDFRFPIDAVEVTSDKAFDGANLVGKRFSEIKGK